MNFNETNEIYNFFNLDEKGINQRSLICTKCCSVFLRAKQASYCHKEIDLPIVSQQKAKEKEKERVFNYLCVDDIYTFENMGFSNTVDGIKYLVCADCEFGPIGFMNISDKRSFLSLDRVIQKEP